MDYLLFSVISSSLIYISQSAPQFPAYPDYPYYRAHSAPQFPSQSNFPGYFYYQHPFSYDPYSNPYYIYNHLGPIQQKQPDSKSTPVDSKPTSTQSESDSSSETRKIKTDTKSAPIPDYARIATPIIPNIQYIPIYGRNVDSWTAKEIPVTVIVDENFEKSYNIPYNPYQDPYVRNYVELPKPTSETASSQTGSMALKTESGSGSNEEPHTISVHETPIEQSQFIQGAPIIPNVASINTPQASISFYPAAYQGFASYGGGRDLGSWNVNEIPISAYVVDEGVTDTTHKSSEKETKPSEEKIDSSSSAISSKN